MEAKDMESDLARLFAEGDDFELCDALYGRIVEAHHNDVHAARLGEEERVVFLVWGAFGVINNGGFQYLFEHRVKGDPDFALSARAFREIGCAEAAEAFERTLALFPGSRPPRDVDRRLRLYNSRIASRPTEMDRQFFRAEASITRSLANYIRTRYGAFRHLETRTS
jgi:hypothetical protein